MSRKIVIRDPNGARRVTTDDFPLSLGGPGNDLPLPGIPAGEPAAWVGISEGELFLQAGGSGEPIVCNGVPVVASHWLRTGDVLGVGAARIRVVVEGGEAGLVIDRAPEGYRTEPPPGMAGESIRPADPEGRGIRIRPIEYRPGGRSTPPRPARRIGWKRAAFAAPVAILVAAGWFLYGSRRVEIRVEPPPDRLVLEAGPWGWRIGDHFRVVPGSYRLIAEKDGYRRLETGVVIGADAGQSFRFTLEPLPGLLAIRTEPSAGAEVQVDGRPVGTTPLDPLELPAGEHRVKVVAERYRVFTRTVSIEGGGAEQVLEAVLEPAWASIGFRTRPPGAAVRVDGREIGVTPVTAEIGAGSRRVDYRLDGFRRHEETVEVIAGDSRDLPVVELRFADGLLKISSVPEGSAVTVNGEYGGQTPVEVALAPGKDHRIEVSKAGYRPEDREVRLDPGESSAIDIRLTVIEGEVEIRARPPDAELLVEGESRGAADGIWNLPAVAQAIEIRKEGFETYRGTILPRPGVPQRIQVTLEPVEPDRPKALPRELQTSQGQTMVRVEPGRFRMGAPRREPGRRSNETLREVELTRAFYLSTREISNGEFRRFRPEHRSGIVGNHSLDADDHPVVRITWEDAVRYCNWLSGQESLPPAYVLTGGRWVGTRPPTTGYRLPLEAEWAWAARYHPGPGPRKYPWGDSLPVAPGSGNYADAGAGALVSRTLAGYADPFPATAPVGEFPPDALGLYNMGGNVAEWIHDLYSLHAGAGPGVEIDPLGPENGDYHVIRGAGWMDSSISELRLTYRDYGRDPRPDVGFRIARYAE